MMKTWGDEFAEIYLASKARAAIYMANIDRTNAYRPHPNDHHDWASDKRRDDRQTGWDATAQDGDGGPQSWRGHASGARRAFLKGQTPLSAAEVTLLYVAILLSSTIYLVGVFTAALVWGNRSAAIAAIATVGLCYLAYMAQIFRPNPIGAVLVAWSVVAGAVAGVVLIW